jgi:hypothetical protein
MPLRRRISPLDSGAEDENNLKDRKTMSNPPRSQSHGQLQRE